MYLQFWKPQRVIQSLAIVFLLLPGSANSQIIDDLFDMGLNTIQAVDSALLDITAISDEEENQIGTELKKEILKSAKTGVSQKFKPGEILKRLQPHCQRKAIKYDTTTLKDEVFNAYTVAGGKIFLNTGLLEKLENVDELAFVIAHELAHNELKHCIHRIQHSYVASKINPTLAIVVQLGYSTYKYPFSKEEERQADEYAVLLMQKAGFKKAGAISFFVSLEKQEGKWSDSNLKAVNDFISTHPTAEERRQRIEKL